MIMKYINFKCNIYLSLKTLDANVTISIVFITSYELFALYFFLYI